MIQGGLNLFLEAAYRSPLPAPRPRRPGAAGPPPPAPLPAPGHILHVESCPPFTSPTPNPMNLPSVPENRNLAEYINAVNVHNMLVMFASMLYERRILVVSKKLSCLSACVQVSLLRAIFCFSLCRLIFYLRIVKIFTLKNMKS
jgi:hypothetical protein